ncbi:MAG: P-loop NTPase fold protein [Nonlabens sp.]
MIFAFGLFIVFRFTNYSVGWSFIMIQSTQLAYIDFIGLILLVFIACYAYSYARKVFLKPINYNTSTYIGDDPIFCENADRLGYKLRAEQVYDVLKSSNFKNSFTIGFVGPWGNGKSSLISLLEQKLQMEPIAKSINLKFLPYLNHDENDIISDFFHQLSSEISKHSGELSNRLLEYLDKLMNFYNDRGLKKLFTPGSLYNKSSTTLESYQQIYRALKKLNFKFVVFIDDLDRLNSIEVLQILKLVRNTANFHNFIFVVALNKDYVLDILTQSGDVADHAFIDKFFQLEVYLPEINKQDLKIAFNGYISDSVIGTDPLKVKGFQEAVYSRRNLFDDYITTIGMSND